MTGYIYGLDLVRCFAALLVAAFHLSWRYPAAEITLDAGWVGVEIFFVISGFVILGSAQGVSPVEFAERRFARLYPAAIACAVIDFAVLSMGGDFVRDYGFAVHWGVADFLRSIALLGGPFLVSALWTIPVELAFYALMLLVLVYRRLDRIDVIALLLACWSATYLIPFVLHMYGLTALPIGPSRSNLFNMTLLRHGCFFSLGILIWLLREQPRNALRVSAFVLTAVLCCLEILARAKQLEFSYRYSINVAMLAAQALTLFLASVLVIWLLARRGAASMRSPRWRHVARTLGLMTYPLYLTHEAVGGTLASSLSRNGLGHLGAVSAGLAASIFASYLVVAAFEPWARRTLMRVVHPLLFRLTRVPSFSRIMGSFSVKGSGPSLKTEPSQGVSTG